MPLDVSARIQTLNQQIEAKRRERDQALGQKASLEQQEQQLRQEMQGLGVTPETIEEEIKKLAAQQEELLAQAETALGMTAVSAPQSAAHCAPAQNSGWGAAPTARGW